MASSKLALCALVLLAIAAGALAGPTERPSGGSENCGAIRLGESADRLPAGESWAAACQKCCERTGHDIGQFVGDQCQCFLPAPRV